jgi:hypothetical protein
MTVPAGRYRRSRQFVHAPLGIANRRRTPRWTGSGVLANQNDDPRVTVAKGSRRMNDVTALLARRTETREVAEQVRLHDFQTPTTSGRDSAQTPVNSRVAMMSPYAGLNSPLTLKRMSIR